ncbi:MAG: hypothetical protein V9E94_17315 [Microthrixaceae bacterium]
MGGSIELPFGLATSVGPLPCDDPVEAARMALRAQPSFPCSPSLGTTAGSLLAQAVEDLDAVQVLPPGLLRAGAALVDGDPSHVDELPAVGLVGDSYAAFHEFVARLSDPPDVGVRVSLLGPVTLALGLRAAGVPTVRAVRIAQHVVARRAEAMLGAVRSVMPGGVVLVCASEPGLVGAVHPTFPLTPAEVLSLLTPYVDAVDGHPDAGELLIGVHVPGRTDWETVDRLGSLGDLGAGRPRPGGVVRRARRLPRPRRSVGVGCGAGGPAPGHQRGAAVAASLGDVVRARGRRPGPAPAAQPEPGGARRRPRPASVCPRPSGCSTWSTRWPPVCVARPSERWLTLGARARHDRTGLRCRDGSVG